MDCRLAMLLAQDGPFHWGWVLAGVLVFGFFAIVMLFVLAMYGGIWFRAYMSNANVSMWSLIGMSFAGSMPK